MSGLVRFKSVHYSKRTAQAEEKKTLLDEVKHDLITTKENDLTLNKDVSSLEEQQKEEPLVPQDLNNPFPNQTPKKVLTRQYKIDEFTITPSWQGVIYSFPQVLYQYPAVQKALSSFYYLQAGVRIRIKINSTQYHQGMMIIGQEADCPIGRDYDVAQLSALDPVTLNYATSDSVDRVIRWVCPELYCTTVYNGGADAIGKIFLKPLVPVLNTTPQGNQNISCTVWAQFIETQTAGFINQPIAQSAQNPRIVSPEAVDKSEAGILQKREPTPLLKPILKEIPLVGEVMDMMEAILDKPTSQQASQKMIVDYTTDQCYGRGLDSSTRLSIYPENRLSTQKMMTGVTTNATWSRLAAQPMIHDIVTFTQLGQQVQYSIHPMYATPFMSANSTVQPDYLMVVTSCFKYWRGSIKYYFQFVTNAFTTARFQISYSIDPTSTNFTEGGDFPNQIVEVKGSTYQTMLVPYLAPTHYRGDSPIFTNPNVTPFPKINIQLMTNPVAQTGDPQISLVVWRAAGPEFQVHQETSSNLFIPLAQCDIQAVFKGKFDPIVPAKFIFESGICASNYGFKINDSLKKYVMHDYSIASNIPQPRRFQWNVTLSDWRSHIEIMRDLFKYKRGSYRFKFFFESAGYPLLSNTPTDDPRSINVVIPTEVAPIASVECPYHAAHAYLAHPSDTYAVFYPYEGGVVSEQTNFVNFVHYSVGDDNQMFYLMPPPILINEPGKDKKLKLQDQVPQRSQKGIKVPQGEDKNKVNTSSGVQNQKNS